MNELDLQAYHSDDQAIEPGQHKVFTIENSIHSFGARFHGASDFGKDPRDTFNQRFEGEPGTLPTQGPSFDSTKMPPWWVRVLGPQTKWPGEGPQPPELGPGVLPVPEMEILPYNPDRPQGKPGLVSMKDKPGMRPNILEQGGAGTRIGETTTREPLLGYSQYGPMTNADRSKINKLDPEHIKEMLSLPGVKPADVANALEISLPTLRQAMDKFGIARSKIAGTPKVSIDKETLEGYLKEGISQQEMASRHGVDKTTIQARLKEHGLSRSKADIESSTRLKSKELPYMPKKESPKGDPEFEEIVRRYLEANPR